jgi:hypothetical protein
MKFKTGHVASIGEVTQVRPDAVAAFGRSDLCVRLARKGVSLSLTALFFGVAYKYVFGWFGESTFGHLDSLTSS